MTRLDPISHLGLGIRPGVWMVTQSPAFPAFHFILLRTWCIIIFSDSADMTGDRLDHGHLELFILLTL